MPTFHFDQLPSWLLWNAAAFVTSLFILNSLTEWLIHRYVMHRLFWLIPYGYAHTTSHHAKFGPDSYTLTGHDDDRRAHILFTWREYVLIPPLCVAAYVPIELLTGKPILTGIFLSAFTGLQMFNSLHWRFHAPSDTWFQRTRFFRFLATHHRLHHEDMNSNFNVYFFPLADYLLRTLKTESKSPAEV
jgi:hypothetical protein